MIRKPADGPFQRFGHTALGKPQIDDGLGAIHRLDATKPFTIPIPEGIDRGHVEANCAPTESRSQ